MKVLAALAGVVAALAIVTAGTAAVEALITGAQIKDGTVESRDIGNGTIRRADIADAAEAALRGQRGARGIAGPQGATGPAGPAGPQGATGLAGPQGPAGAQGPQGLKGDIGEGLHVTGSVADTDDLLDVDAEVGDAYIVTADDHLYIWDGEDWADAGLVRGPTGAQGPTGPTGPAGPQGPAGPTGAAGADGGLVGYEIVTGAPVAFTAADWIVSGSAACPAGKLAVGGGARVADAEGIDLVESYPTVAGSSYGWTVSIANDPAIDSTVTAYAVCANAA